MCPEFRDIEAKSDREYTSKINPYEQRYVFDVPEDFNDDE